MSERWTVDFRIFRKKGDQPPYYQSFRLEVDPDEYVLDAVERVWAFHDRSLTFRHACHHATCGACGMRVNGVEKLACITPIRSITRDGGVVQIEPMRNFPVVSDLVVDMSTLYLRLEEARFDQVAPLSQAKLPYERPSAHETQGEYERLVDCIECGLCISACPISQTTEGYVGPAVLAALHHSIRAGDEELIAMADNEDGVWRCHSAFECSAVCPSNVDPGWRIMDLRRQAIRYRWRSLFNKKEGQQP